MKDSYWKKYAQNLKRKEINAKRERIRCGEFYCGLVDQIQGLIQTEVENYVYAKDFPDIHFDRWVNGGMDVYIYDENIATLDKWDKIQTDYEDVLLIEHLHYDDMLYFILNFDKEKKKMFECVDRYMKFKEDYEKVGKYKTQTKWLPIVTGKKR